MLALMNWKMPFSTPQATETNSPKKANLLAGKTDLNYRGETGSLPYNGSKEDDVWNQGIH